jgi:hypothetical protein
MRRLPLAAIVWGGVVTAVAVLCPGAGRPMAAQIGEPYQPSQEVEVTLGATAPSFHVSDGIAVVASFHNRLQDAVRARKFSRTFDVLFRDAAGLLYIPAGNGAGFGSEDTFVMQTDEVQAWDDVIASLQRADAAAQPLPDVEGIPLQVGDYDIELRSYQNLGPSQPLFQERVADGVVVSNIIRVSVVPDDQALAVPPRLRKGDTRLARVFRLRNVEMVSDRALSAYGVTAKRGKEELVLQRGKQKATLPQLRLARREKNGPPLPAIASPTDHGCYVPLRYVAGQLGLTVSYDIRRQLYDLRPAG